MAFLMDYLKNSKVEVIRQEFTENCFIEINVALHDAEEIIQKVQQFPTVKIINKGIY